VRVFKILDKDDPRLACAHSSTAQSRAKRDTQFFKTNAVDLEHIAGSMLVTLDCTSLKCRYAEAAERATHSGVWAESFPKRVRACTNGLGEIGGLLGAMATAKATAAQPMKTNRAVSA
jgi:hypothetical protein